MTDGWVTSSFFSTGIVNGSAWAMVNLGTIYNISMIKVTDFVDGTWNRLKAYKVYISTNNIDFILVSSKTDLADISGRVDIISLNKFQATVGGM